MTFNHFQTINLKRCKAAFDKDAHDLPFFAIAIAGESGEFCNLLKKVLRGDFPLESVRNDLLEELADIITYCDLAISKLDGDTTSEIRQKFNKVSDRRGCNIYL